MQKFGSRKAYEDYFYVLSTVKFCIYYLVTVALIELLIINYLSDEITACSIIGSFLIAAVPSLLGYIILEGIIRLIFTGIHLVIYGNTEPRSIISQCLLHKFDHKLCRRCWNRNETTTMRAGQGMLCDSCAKNAYTF